jgi:hypothetical protein
VVVLLLVALGVAGCGEWSCTVGSSSTSTSVTSGASTTTTPTTTTASTTTSTASTTTSTTLSPLDTYKVKMRAWKNTYAADLAASYAVISKMGILGTPSQEEIQAAKDLDEAMGGMVRDLENIQPPPQLSAAHAEYLASLKDLAEGVHELAQALEDGKSWRSVGAIATIAAAWEAGTPARTTLEQALGFSLSAAN